MNSILLYFCTTLLFEQFDMMKEKFNRRYENTMKKDGILESRKFKIAVGVINICLIIGLTAYLIFSLVSKERMSALNQDIAVAAKEYSADDPDAAMEDAEDKMLSVYATLLQGSTVNLDDTKVMYFEIDGSFDGFFDTDNPDVKGYSYEVISLEDNSAPYVANVNIYNEDKTAVVQYKLSFDEDSNMQLYYPEIDQNFKLEF